MDYFDRDTIKCVLYWKWYFKSEVGLHSRPLIIVVFSLSVNLNYTGTKLWSTEPLLRIMELRKIDTLLQQYFAI